MTSFNKLELIINQKNYKLAINILEANLEKNPDDDLFNYLLGKCYLEVQSYSQSFKYLQKAALLNPYGTYKAEIYSLTLNELAVSGKVITNRPKLLLDLLNGNGVHARGLYPIADVMTLNNVNDNFKPDYFIIPNWISPIHPIAENLDLCPYPVVSMIVDRLIHSEEHIKPNLVYSDIIIAMENYGIDLYKNLGFTNVLYIPGAASIGYDPYVYPKLNLGKKYDVVFLGNISSFLMYRHRNKILKKLDSLKTKYNILIGPADDFTEYWTLMNQAKIVLDATIDSDALNYRMFQAMGIETLCFVEDDNEMVRELYNDREDLVLYNIDNLDSLIGFYLDNQSERERIAKNGYLKTINNYTHYHFLKMLIDRLVKFQPAESQKKRFSKSKSLLYKGITKHYQHKAEQAIEFFEEITEPGIEVLNNLMVEKIKLYEKSNETEKLNLVTEIKNYFSKNSESIIILFNYISFLFFHEKKFSECSVLLDKLLGLIEEKYDTVEELGLYYICEREKEIEINYFRFYHGQIIYKYGLDTKEYYQGYLRFLKEHCYRFKGLINLEIQPGKALSFFKKSVELGSENVWDFFNLAGLEKKFGNNDESKKYFDYCRELLPFNSFSI